MRWRRGTGGGQVEDRRGAGGGFGIPAAGGGLGLVAVVIYLLVNALAGGGAATPIDPRLDPFPTTPSAQQGDAPDPDAKLVDFVKFVVKDVQDSWTTTFQRAGRTYEPTKLVLFDTTTSTACGTASSQTGPFYCPGDRRVYLDLGFFRELRDRFGAPGDFAQAYVIAHEFGHHVQNLTGVFDQVQREQSTHPDKANDLSIRTELQADCLAGVWAHSAYQENLLENGDLEEGLRAASAVGDDRLQRQASGRIDRESWTHGSSEQRSRWFRRGYDKGDPGACDTFSGQV